MKQATTQQLIQKPDDKALKNGSQDQKAIGSNCSLSSLVCPTKSLCLLKSPSQPHGFTRVALKLGITKSKVLMHGALPFLRSSQVFFFTQLSLMAAPFLHLHLLPILQ